ncbi:hypothetical protein EDB84DRAFT_1434130 [Lactarius hengduanensis]|nr:hypothetical protein EDB84DRAFT_1434130 [Lactarius hengduanensis]
MLAGPWVAAGVVPQQLCGDRDDCGRMDKWRVWRGKKMECVGGGTELVFFRTEMVGYPGMERIPTLEPTNATLATCTLCSHVTLRSNNEQPSDQIASPTLSRFHFPSVWQGFSNPHGYSPKELGGYGSGTGSRVFADHKQPDVLMPPPPCAFKPPSCTPPRRYDTDIVARKPCRVAATPRQRHASPAGCYDTSMAYEPCHVATTPTQRHASPAGRSDTGTACEPRRVATTPTQRFLPPPSTLLYTCTRLKPTSDVRYLLWHRHTCRLLAIVERGPLLGPLWCLIAT